MNTELDRLADRHFRPDPQGVFAGAISNAKGRVLVRIGQDMGRSIAGQHLTWMLVNLLCRQFRVVREIILDAPNARLHTHVAPFGERELLTDTLIECCRLVSGPHVRATELHEVAECDVELVVGSGFSLPESTNVLRAWRVYADGWRYYVGTSEAFPRTTPVSEISIGPYMAACHAAGEAFKFLRGMKKGKGTYTEDLFGSAWTSSTERSWPELIDGPLHTSLCEIPHFYLAGGGAVAQAAALCLGTSRLRGSCTVIDADHLDLSNDNRYVLSNREHEGDPKVSIIANHLNQAGIACHPVESWWADYTGAMGSSSIYPQVASLERRSRYPLVLSCVDENHPRHELQNLLPHVIIGGSTYGLTAKVITFDLSGRSACLKCHNPLRERNAVAFERREKARKMTVSERVEYAEELNMTPEALKSFINASGCGQLSESDIDRFSAATPQMSVGFVSAAAGTLLASQFLRVVTLGAERAATPHATLIATFADAKIFSIIEGVDAKCDCKEKLRPRWRSLWNNSWIPQ